MARGGFSTEVEFKGLDKPLAALRRLRDLGSDLRPFMEDARGILVASVLRRFQSGRGPDDIPWPISKRAAGLVKGKPAGRTLVDTGDLQDSIRGEVSSNSVEVGSDGLKNPVKAIANQFGSHRQAVVLAHRRTVRVAFGVVLKNPVQADVRAHGRITNLPARPFIGIDANDERDVEEAWKARLIATFNGAANGQ